MADGLPGHEPDFYPIDTDSQLRGGTDYNDLNEGYWFNGLVPLAFLGPIAHGAGTEPVGRN
jgi:hypothetical protein